MKKIIIAIVILIGISLQSFSQTPQAIGYQSIVRDLQGKPLANTNVSLKFSILSGNATGSPVYVETHLVTTNQFGLVTLKIGKGTVVSGTFSSINWGTSTYFNKIEADITGGTSFSEIGTSEILSVPYALNAKTAESVNLTAGEGIAINGSQITNSAPNQNQVLSISNDTIYLTNGGFVKLPNNQSQSGLSLGGNASMSVEANNNFSNIIPLGLGHIYNIIYTADNYIYMTGKTSNDELFIKKLNLTGSVVWEKNIIGTGINSNLAIDASNNVYLIGQYDGSITIGTNTFTEGTQNVGSFLAKFDASGNLAWANNFQNTYIKNIVCSSNSIYIAGTFESDWNNDTPEKPFIGKYDYSGTSLLSTEIVGRANCGGCFSTSDLKFNNDSLYWLISIDEERQFGSLTINGEVLIKLDLDLNPQSSYSWGEYDRYFRNFGFSVAGEPILIFTEPEELLVLDNNLAIKETHTLSSGYNDVIEFNGKVFLSGNYSGNILINETLYTAFAPNLDNPIIVQYDRSSKSFELNLLTKTFVDMYGSGLYLINSIPYQHIKTYGSFYNKGIKHTEGNYLITK